MILTRGLEPPEVLMEVAGAHGVPVIQSTLMSSTMIGKLTRFLEEALAPRATIHGVLLDVLGVGLLLIGRSGVGKSEAALELILKGHRLVADDVVQGLSGRQTRSGAPRRIFISTTWRSVGWGFLTSPISSAWAR